MKLYAAEEPGREEVQAAVEGARAVAVSEIGYVEARSALARKEREGALSREQHDAAVEQLERDFEEVYLSRRLTGEVVARAGDLARQHALRAYDSVHLATALALRSEARELLLRVRRGESAGAATQEGNEPLPVLLMSYDSSLNEAARKEALAYEPEAPSQRVDK